MTTCYVLPLPYYTPIDLLELPSKDEILQELKGKPFSTIRTSALFLDRAIIEKNRRRMGESAKK